MKAILLVSYIPLQMFEVAARWLHGAALRRRSLGIVPFGNYD
jgi:hypothetical protein